MHLKLFRRLSAFAAGLCTAAACLTGAVCAEPTLPKLPFDLTKPSAVSVTETTGKAVNNIKLSFKKTSLINKWSYAISTEKTRIKNSIGLTDLYIQAQMDWSIDSYNDWHYNAYWDNDGYDANWNKMVGSWAYLNIPVTAQEFDSEMIFQNIGNPADPDDIDWNGTVNAPGWKTVLKDGQYDVVDGSDGKKQVKIDLSKHAVCVRIRWKAVLECDDWEKDVLQFSEWSDVAIVGNKSAIADTPSDTTAATTTHTAVTTTETTAETEELTSSDAAQTDVSSQSGSTSPDGTTDQSGTASDQSTVSSAPADDSKTAGSGWIWAGFIVGFIIVGALAVHSYSQQKRKNRNQ